MIKARKPLFEKQVDRTIVNVQSRVTAAGSTALEVLEKSPGVTVNRQTNSINLSGKSGVLVMINDKVSRLPIDALVQMLNGMSAANIEKIELITSPPAKYDAEGKAGIVHIVMTENPDAGTNGSVGGTLGYNRGETLGGNLNLNHRRNRFNSFLNYSILHDQNQHQWMHERYYTDGNFTRSTVGNSQRIPITTVQNLQAGLEYDITHKTTGSLLLTAYRKMWDMAATTTNINTIAPDSAIVTDMDIQEINRWQSVSGSLGLNHRLNDRQHLDFSFDYLYYYNNNPSEYHNHSFLNYDQLIENEVIQVDKHTPIHFKIAKLDYANKVSDILYFEAGTKATFSQFSNEVSVARLAEGNTVIDPAFTDSAELDEKILAAYGSWNLQPGQNWRIQAGLRYEYTDTYLSTPEQEGLVDRQNGNLFPTLNVTYKIAEQQSLQMAYNRRITRPTFNDMAPFVFFVGPSTFVSGNLSLRPAISDGLDISYQLKQWWVSLKYNHSQNEIAFLQPEFNPKTNEQIFRSQNLKYMHAYGINTTFPVAITPWWEMQHDISFYVYDYQTKHLAQNVRKNVNSLTLNLNNTFTMANDFTVELSGYYQSASVWGISRFQPMGAINLGVSKTLKNDAKVSLVVNDLLNTSIWKLEMDREENLSSSMRYDWGVRSINLTYTYNFGSSKLKAVRIKSGSDNERQRVQ